MLRQCAGGDDDQRKPGFLTLEKIQDTRWKYQSLFFWPNCNYLFFNVFNVRCPLFITLFCLSGSHIAQFSGEGAKLLLLGDQETSYLLTPAVTLSSPPAPALLDLDMWTLTQDYNWWEIFWFWRCHAFDDIYLFILSKYYDDFSFLRIPESHYCIIYALNSWNTNTPISRTA